MSQKDTVLSNIYYNPKYGFSGINDLVRKSNFSTKEIQKWLEKQNVYSLHKPIKIKFPTRRVIVSHIDDQWQADLVDMQKFKNINKNTNYILTVIDIFSKYAWAMPIKKKTGEEISKAFNKIFKERFPKKIQTDKGLEFINKNTQNLFKKLGIYWFTTENETKAQIVERLNRTLKTKMFKYFTHNNTRKWIDVIDDFIFNYNNSYHRTIKMTPIEASKDENLKTVYNNLYPKQKDKNHKPIFKKGDRVRISKKRKDFRKGYLPNYTDEVFVITQVLDTNPITYKIKDFSNEEILGSFYEPELVLYNNELYEIEKVVKQNKNKILVKWKGYDETTWINKHDVFSL